MNGRDGAGWPVLTARRKNRLRTTNLAEKYSVGAQAHRGLQKALDRHARLALIAFGGDQRRKFFCSGFTSRVSSIVMMRSSGGTSFKIAFKNVVLPDDVPPESSMV